MTKLRLADRANIAVFMLQGVPFEAGNLTGNPRNTWDTPRDALTNSLTRKMVGSATEGWHWEPRLLQGYTLNTWVSDGMTNHVDYVVWSYSEPIAWHVSDGEDHWVLVGDKFTTTTSRHQGIVRDAMSLVTRWCLVTERGWASEWVPVRYNDEDSTP